jgi:hypothetical protein
MLLDNILEKYDDIDFLKVDGFDSAIVGVDEYNYKLIYSNRKIIQILVDEHDMSLDESFDYFYYNIIGAYHGEKTPIFMDDMF